MDDLFVKSDVLRNYLRGRISLDGKFTAAFAKGTPQVFVAEQPQRVCRHFFDIADIAQKAGFTVVDHLGNTADTRRDDRNFARLSFECREAERFQFRRQQKYVGDAQIIGDICLFADER